MPTRLNSQGVAGQKSKPNATGIIQNRGDYALATKPFVLPLVATTDPQATGVMIKPGQTHNIFLNVTTEETTGTTKTVDVGFVGGTGQELMGGVDVSSSGIKIAADSFNGISAPQELSYTLGSADFAELDAEFVLTMVESS